MRLVTIRPRDEAGAFPADPAAAAGGPPQVHLVAVLLDGGAALTLGALARISGWPVTEAIDQLSIVDLLEADPDFTAIKGAVEAADPAALEAFALAPDTFALGAPIPRPGKIIGVGYNYLDHIREQGLERPARPVLFSMFANAVAADASPIRKPAGTHALDLEAEMAVVIGRRASNVEPAAAMTHVAGYTAANDVTARDWQGQPKALRPGEKGDGQWLRAKGSDTFLPLGPVFVTADEMDAGSGHSLASGGDGGNASATGDGPSSASGPSSDAPAGRGLRVRSWRTASDGVEPFQMQDGNTSDLLFSVADLISIISREVTLNPGDVIVTGTPAGVGVFREPQIFLEPGDLVTVEVERIGRLTNPVTDEFGNAPAGSAAARFIAARAGRVATA